MNETRDITYELLLYLNYVFFYIFTLFEVIMGVLIAWATNNYPTYNALLPESCLFILLYLVEVLRIYLGSRGNLVNKKAPVFCSILLTIPSVTGICYFLFYQTYILRLEHIFGAVLLMFQAVELVYGISFLVTVCDKPSQ